MYQLFLKPDTTKITHRYLINYEKGSFPSYVKVKRIHTPFELLSKHFLFNFIRISTVKITIQYFLQNKRRDKTERETSKSDPLRSTV